MLHHVGQSRHAQDEERLVEQQQEEAAKVTQDFEEASCR
jgi:hypothetical protein